MRQKYEIDALGVESEVFGIVIGELTAALVHAAVDQEASASAFNQMAGAGNALRGTVELDLHAETTSHSGSHDFAPHYGQLGRMVAG